MKRKNRKNTEMLEISPAVARLHIDAVSVFDALEEDCGPTGTSYQSR